MPRTERCPHCGYENNPGRTICWSCKLAMVIPQAPPPPPQPPTVAPTHGPPPGPAAPANNQNQAQNACGGCVLLLILLIWIGSCMGGGGGSTDPDYAKDSNGLTKIDVYSMAHQFVEDNLKAPSTAKFPWGADEHSVVNLGGTQYRVSAWVDAQNGFGAMIRSDWTVVMTYQGNDRWTLDDIQLSEP